MQRRAIFQNKLLPYVLLAPQIVIPAVFFFWPAGQAIYQSFLLQDAFGLRQTFVGFENFRTLLADPPYLDSAGGARGFPAPAPRPPRGPTAYKPLLVCPSAVAPAVAAVLWLFIFHPSIGLFGQALRRMGVPWDYKLNGAQAMFLVILAAAWKQVSYNFLFFLAGPQSIRVRDIERRVHY